MKWIHALREKFTTSPAAPEKPAQQSRQSRPDTPAKPARGANAVAPKPVEDIDRLRLMLAACSDNTERAPLAARLGLALAQGARAPNADDLPEVWVAAICHAQDKAMAQTWLASLDAETGLAEVAMRARGAEVRYAAARRIEDGALLEHVAQASRDKDKRVHRHCADLLRQRRQAEASALRADEIAAELQSLLEKAPLPLSRLLALKQDLAALTAAGEAGQRCEALLNGAFARVHQESETLRDLHARQSAAATLATECARAEWPWREQAEDWRIRAEALARFRDGLPSWLAGETTARMLNSTLSEIETCRAARAADLERYDSCDAFLTALESADTASSTSEITATWAATAKPEHPDALASLTERWQAAHSKLAPPPAPEATPAPAESVEPTHESAGEPTSEATKKPARAKTRVDQHAVVLLLDKLEQTIEQGHLVDADATAKQIKNLLGDNSLRGNLETRLHQLHAQLETLRGWAKWGTGQAREQLIASASALLGGERDTGALALAITALREAWKRLNVHGAATKEQWESFDAILEQAYQPVAAHREEVAARQAEARAAKEALCDAWESELAELDWEHADFKVVEARRAELLQQWRDAPQAGFRHERQLRKRFDPLIAGIDQRLDAARTAEIERREQLIAAAEALADQADLGRAMTEAKALQTSWNQQPTPVRLKRGVDEKLWQRFRAACNAVFARRDAQRAEQSSQQQARIQARQAHLDDFASVLKSGDADAVKKAMAAFRAEWAPGRTDARDTGDSLEIQARALQQQAQQILAAQSEAKNRAHHELLALKASLAGRVEAAALARQPLDTILVEARQAWDSLQSLPGREENLLARRFAAAGDLTPAAAEANRAALATLLLDLEIALGLPSPEPYAQARRERQLARLQSRFGATVSQSDDASALLVQAYAMSVPPDTVFEQRIAAAVQNLTRQGSSA